MKDRGSDVILRFNDGSDQSSAGLQIKSYREISKWLKKQEPEFVNKLRSQYTQAIEEARLDKWYLVLCTDADAHIDGIRLLCSIFDGYHKCKIIPPRQALTFYEFSSWEIDATATRILCRGDRVLADAKNEIENFSYEEIKTLLRLTIRALNGEATISDTEITDLLMDEETADQAAEIVGKLEQNLLELTDAGYAIQMNRFPAVCAVYYDLKVRYRISDQDIVRYMQVVLSASRADIEDDMDEDDDWEEEEDEEK